VGKAIEFAVSKRIEKGWKQKFSLTKRNIKKRQPKPSNLTYKTQFLNSRTKIHLKFNRLMERSIRGEPSKEEERNHDDRNTHTSHRRSIREPRIMLDSTAKSRLFPLPSAPRPKSHRGACRATVHTPEIQVDGN
jgi:hypothetical protein